MLFPSGPYRVVLPHRAIPRSALCGRTAAAGRSRALLNLACQHRLIGSRWRFGLKQIACVRVGNLGTPVRNNGRRFRPAARSSAEAAGYRDELPGNQAVCRDGATQAWDTWTTLTAAFHRR